MMKGTMCCNLSVLDTNQQSAITTKDSSTRLLKSSCRSVDAIRHERLASSFGVGDGHLVELMESNLRSSPTTRSPHHRQMETASQVGPSRRAIVAVLIGCVDQAGEADFCRHVQE